MNRFLYVALLAIGTSVLQADPVDPVFSMGDPTTGTPVTTSTFIFGADALGGGVLSFVNDSGILFQNLEIKVTEVTGTAISLPSGLFFNTPRLSSTPAGDGINSIFTIDLFNTGQTSEGGIPNGQFFTINLNDFINNSQPPTVDGAGGWGPFKDFSATANTVSGAQGTVPEPASILLLAGGLGLVWYRTRKSLRHTDPTSSQAL